MLNKWFWYDIIIKQQKQEHYINREMDPLDNPLWTQPMQTGWENSIKLYPDEQFGCIDNSECKFGNSLVPTWSHTWSDGPQPLLTLIQVYQS